MDLLVPAEQRDRARTEADHLPKLVVSERELSDLEMLAVGALSPLTGFVGEADYLSVLDTMHLSNGLAWSIPVTLSLTDEDVKRIGAGTSVALLPAEGAPPLAIVDLTEVFKRDREKEALAVFGTEDLEHPGVGALQEAGDFCLAGPVRALTLPSTTTSFGTASLPRRPGPSSPTEAGVPSSASRPATRSTGYEYIQNALEIVDGLLVHPLVGATKGDDVPADVRMRCYEALFEGYPKDRAMVSVPAAMRYAGPKEAIWHAICRKNYGCTHFIVGRDHAGVGSYYGTYDAQRIFDSFESGELGITPLMFEHSFWCNACGGWPRPRPVREDTRVSLSGTRCARCCGPGSADRVQPSRGRRDLDRRDAGRMSFRSRHPAFAR